MKKTEFPGGEWPVMLTPFTKENQVDYLALETLVSWYIEHGVKGLFAVCQSSEMFYLTLEERLQVARCVVKAAAGRVPVIASGHVSDTLEDQAEELNRMAETGVDAVILITNRLAKEEESDEIWMKNCRELLRHISSEIPLGFYECPYPYKRLLSLENLKWCAQTGRFYFLKDTCCDIRQIREKLDVIKGTNLRLYNANTTTLLESLRAGAAGYSGVMANFHPQLYAWLCDHYQEKKAEELQDFLSIASLIERQWYPVNAKYHLREIEGLPMTTISRTKDASMLTETFQTEIKMLDRMARRWEEKVQEEK
ncbi:MAG: dihydrodipicolinate synthase family protein [bacterium]|nr:dihydrodipicolinate synthase family protein [bacterium]